MDNIDSQSDFLDSRFEFHEIELGIITNRMNPFTSMSYDDVLHELLIFKANSLATGIKYPILLDVTGLRELNKEGRKLAMSKESENYVRAVAFVGSTDIARLIINFTIGNSEASYPVKAFSNRADAKAWLTEMILGTSC